jgi:hypothetical protein
MPTNDGLSVEKVVGEPRKWCKDSRQPAASASMTDRESESFAEQSSRSSRR